MTYRLWWTVGYVCTSEKEFLAAKHRLLPAAYEMLDDALRRANQVGQAGDLRRFKTNQTGRFDRLSCKVRFLDDTRLSQ